ncbi:MAG: ATP-binding protein [Clostridia bacterium]|nr:ATP-binding protein [Clostridia bacterium]
MEEMNNIFCENLLHKKYSDDIMQTMCLNMAETNREEAESMIISVRANNFLVFSNEVQISMKADMRIKRFDLNVFNGNGFNILKSACVFGPNGAGKTCLMKAIQCIRDVILGTAAGSDITPNWYSGSTVSSLGIAFYYKGKVYSYDFSYEGGDGQSDGRGFIYESFKEHTKDKYGNERVKEIFLRDRSKGIYRLCGDDAAGEGIENMSGDVILIYGLDGKTYPAVRECRDILTGFASLIDVVNLDNISVDKTIEAFKYNKPIKEKVLRLIKMSDAYIDDFRYIDESADIQYRMLPGDLRNLHNAPGVNRDDYYKLYSYYNGVPKQIMLTGSNGTKKLVALASYMIDALDNGKILVVDEMESSLHISLIKDLVVLFNLESNYNGQLIFTTQNILMMDCKNLFRKDQIWFVDRTREKSDVYPLSDFTSSHNKIRSESELLDKYLSGYFDAIPNSFYLDLNDDIPGDGR